MKYHVVTYGCQMNIADAERVSAVLENTKYKNTSNINEADLIVVMMCSIRQSAVDRVYGLMEKFEAIKKVNRRLKTVLTGCVLKRDKKIFTRLDQSGQANGFDYILDIKDIKKLPDILNIKNTLKNKKDYLDIAPKHISKFSANIPIMTGCNNFCSYCVVPYVREREISRSTKEIISEVKSAVDNGYKEIWLLGQNVNSYKDPADGTNFPKLLKMVNEISGKFWIRFTSSHPKDFNSEVIDAMAKGGNITPYLNLPIQSGDDKVLKAMNRHYSVKDYKNKIKKLRNKIPGICLSTDIIVGFPGETKKQFDNTVKLFKDIKYDMAYISKYSSRAGTAAAKLKDDVSWEEKKRREKVLTEALKQAALQNNKKIVGKKSIVLISEKKNNSWFGKNEHYKTIKINSEENLEGKFVKVKITEASAFTLKGELINE